MRRPEIPPHEDPSFCILGGNNPYKGYWKAERNELMPNWITTAIGLSKETLILYRE